jgi:F-type H+-transporting ATPase subunit delta
MVDLIAKRYVNALLGSSTPQTRADYSETLNTISSIFSNKDVASFIASPVVEKDKKISLIIDSLGDNIDTTMKNFIRVVGENGRLELVPAISKMLNYEIQKDTNKYDGKVYSSGSLTQDELNSLEERLKAHTGSQIALTQVDDSFDGMKVVVEDLGIEVNFSKQRVKEQLIEFITKALS